MDLLEPNIFFPGIYQWTVKIESYTERWGGSCPVDGSTWRVELLVSHSLNSTSFLQDDKMVQLYQETGLMGRLSRHLFVVSR